MAELEDAWTLFKTWPALLGRSWNSTACRGSRVSQHFFQDRWRAPDVADEMTQISRLARCQPAVWSRQSVLARARNEYSALPRVVPKSKRLGGANTLEQAIAWMITDPKRCDSLQSFTLYINSKLARFMWQDGSVDRFGKPGERDDRILRAAIIDRDYLAEVARTVVKHMRPASAKPS